MKIRKIVEKVGKNLKNNHKEWNYYRSLFIETLTIQKNKFWCSLKSNTYSFSTPVNDNIKVNYIMFSHGLSRDSFLKLTNDESDYLSGIFAIVSKIKEPEYNKMIDNRKNQLEKMSREHIKLAFKNL